LKNIEKKLGVIGMNFSTIDLKTILATNVFVTDETLTVDLSDGRTISIPLSWFPRLMHGSVEERKNWRLIGRGEGIHWEDLDEDIEVESLILGVPSGESQRSLKGWLARRGQANG
jgi:hypothetical protein